MEKSSLDTFLHCVSQRKIYDSDYIIFLGKLFLYDTKCNLCLSRYYSMSKFNNYHINKSCYGFLEGVCVISVFCSKPVVYFFCGSEGWVHL